MGSSTKLTAQAQLTGTETLDSTTSPASVGGGNSRRFNAYNLANAAFDSATAPAVDSPPVDLSHTLSGSSGTLDLTAIPLARDVAKTTDLTGKKLVAILIHAPAANSADITIKPAAANGYNLFGGASDQVTLHKGKTVLLTYEVGPANANPAVAAGAKDITITGTSGDKIEAIAYFGS